MCGKRRFASVFLVLYVCPWGAPVTTGAKRRQPRGSSPAEAADAGVGHDQGVNFEAFLVCYLPASPGAAPPSWGAHIPKPPNSEGPCGQSQGGCGFQNGSSPSFLFAGQCGCAGQSSVTPRLPQTLCPGSDAFGADPGPCTSGIVYRLSHWRWDSSPAPTTTTRFVLVMRGGEK